MTVLIAGRPYAMEEIERLSDAIIYAFYPGPMGGKAIAGLIYGEIEPAGRLPASLRTRWGSCGVLQLQGLLRRHALLRLAAERPALALRAGLSYTSFSWREKKGPHGALEGENPGENGVEIGVEAVNTGGPRGLRRAAALYPRTPGHSHLAREAAVRLQKAVHTRGRAGEFTLRIAPESLRQWDGERWVTPRGA